MKTGASKTVRWLGVAVLAGGFILAIWQRREIGNARTEQVALAQTSGEAGQLARDNEALSGLRATNEEVKRLRRGEEELARLRGEVERLRAQATESRRIRAENERMTGLAERGETNAFPAGYMKRAEMADVGLGTPEATVETMLCAMSHGDIRRVAQCSGQTQEIPASEVEFQGQGMRNSFSNFAGFYVSDRKVISADEEVLEVRAVGGGVVMPLHLARNGNEWFVGGFE